MRRVCLLEPHPQPLVPTRGAGLRGLFGRAGTHRRHAPLFRDRRFFVVIVTPCEQKRDCIEKEIRRTLRSQMPWELQVVPELLQLLTWLEVH